MAYSGYLLKVLDDNGDYTFPNNKIQLSSYNVKVNTLYDDSYTDGDGVTHAHALDHKIDKIKFNTIPMTNGDLDAIMSEVSARYTESLSRSFTAQFFVPEINDYATADVHLGDFEAPIDRVDDINNVVYYNPISFTITVW